MKYLIYLFFLFILHGCEKTTRSIPLVYSEAFYKMQVTMHWTTPAFTVPGGAHVTSLIGMTHARDTFLWKENMLATQGLEDVAEVGNTTKMNAEMDGIIARMRSNFKFQIPAPANNGMVETTVQLSTAYPEISFASMVAPSPDWFLGISNVSLMQNNIWLDSLILPIKVYDAGTEEGNVFNLNNPATVPAQPVKILTPVNGSVLANGNSTIAPIATVRFIKL